AAVPNSGQSISIKRCFRLEAIVARILSFRFYTTPVVNDGWIVRRGTSQNPCLYASARPPLKLEFESRLSDTRIACGCNHTEVAVAVRSTMEGAASNPGSSRIQKLCVI